jgi:hypothetical protein
MEILPLVPAPVVVFPDVFPGGVVTEDGEGEAAEAVFFKEQVGAARASGRAVRNAQAVENFMVIVQSNACNEGGRGGRREGRKVQALTESLKRRKDREGKE